SKRDWSSDVCSSDLGGGHQHPWHGVFTRSGQFLFGSERRPRPGGRPESYYFSLPVFHCAGRAGHGNSELLPHLWIARGYARYARSEERRVGKECVSW